MTGGHGLRGIGNPTEGVSTTVDRMHLSADDEEEDGTDEMEHEAVYGWSISDLTSSSSGSYVGGNDWAERMPDLIDPNRDTIPVIGRLGDHLREGHERAFTLADNAGLRHTPERFDDVLEVERLATRSDNDWSFGDTDDFFGSKWSVIHQDVLHDLTGESQHTVGILTVTASDVNVSAPEAAGWDGEVRDQFLGLLEQAMAQDASGTALMNYRMMEVALNNVADDMQRGVFPTDPGGKGVPASENVAKTEELKKALNAAAGRGAYQEFFDDLLFGGAPEGMSQEEDAAWHLQTETELSQDAPALLRRYRELNPHPATVGEIMGRAEEPHVPVLEAGGSSHLWLPLGSLVTVADPDEEQAEFTGTIEDIDELGRVLVSFFDQIGQDPGKGIFHPNQLVQAVTDEKAFSDTPRRPVTDQALMSWQEDVGEEGMSVMLYPEAEEGLEIPEVLEIPPLAEDEPEPSFIEEDIVDTELAVTSISPEPIVAPPVPVQRPFTVEVPAEEDEDDGDKEAANSFEINDRGPPFGPHNLSVNPRTNESMGMSSREAAIKLPTELAEE
tara:strand:- start:1935 stop:3605 length:1671 start_codon:yes stop_codon:yes gene_type:complete